MKRNIENTKNTKTKNVTVAKYTNSNISKLNLKHFYHIQESQPGKPLNISMVLDKEKKITLKPPRRQRFKIPRHLNGRRVPKPHGAETLRFLSFLHFSRPFFRFLNLKLTLLRCVVVLIDMMDKNQPEF